MEHTANAESLLSKERECPEITPEDFAHLTQKYINRKDLSNVDKLTSITTLMGFVLVQKGYGDGIINFKRWVGDNKREFVLNMLKGR